MMNNQESILSVVKSAIMAMLNTALSISNDNQIKPPITRPFIPSKSICENDHSLIDILNSPGNEDVCYCICDPDLDDTPIVFASEGFCKFTGYSCDEIEGRNCRFLQGDLTSKKDVDRIRNALNDEMEANVNLLNYKKDGSTFINQFYLAPLHGKGSDTNAANAGNATVCYYIGVQCSVPNLGPGQMPANPGWVYTQGNHV